MSLRGGAFRHMCVYALCRTCGSRELRFVVLCCVSLGPRLQMEMEMLALSRGACSGTEEVEKIKMAAMAKRILDTRPRNVRYSPPPPHAARCSFHLRTLLNVALTWDCLLLSPPAPHINYTLNDDEIMTDLSLMKKRELPPSGTSLYLWFFSPTTCECRPRAALMDSFPSHRPQEALPGSQRLDGASAERGQERQAGRLISALLFCVRAHHFIALHLLLLTPPRAGRGK